MRPSELLARMPTLAAQARGVVRALLIARGTSAHPQVDGHVTVEGVQAPLEVLRDRFGVPHIFAGCDEDAIFGQGFVHAQDRLFQMDAMRRLASGRVAEAAGPSGLESDRFMRRLGLADRAARDLALAAPDDRLLLQAYARGVNEGVRSLSVLPPEFALLGGAPEPWHAEHSLLLGRLLLFIFAYNWDTELLRERLLEELGAERAAEVEHVYPAGAATAAATPHAPAADRLLGAYEAAQEAGLLVGPASNAWAVDASRTATGAPLLASDPHLQVQMPGLFHVCHARGASMDVIGASVPGIPGVAIGHNGAVAWGLTAGAADVSDCYIETIDPEMPTRYLTPEGWVTGRTRVERIAVVGGDTVEEHVLETRHGPVVGPALPGEERAVALRSTALEEGELASAFLGLMRARDGAGLEAALDNWAGSSFNFVWASHGGIGYRLAGRIPRREHGGGLLPQNGATSPGPPAPLPPEALPRLVDPPEGVVVSANNAPGGDVELGEEWFEPWRAERIQELLDGHQDHSVASMQAIQLDLHSRPLLMLRDLLIETGAFDGAGGESDAGAVERLLAAWDGQVAAGSAAAAVVESIYIELAKTLVTRVAGPSAPIILGNGVHRTVPASTFHYRLQGPLIKELQSPRPPWLEDAEDRDRLLRAATARVLMTLRRRLGDDATRWRWGDLHGLRLGHLLGDVPLVGRSFSRGPYPYGGDVNTVNAGGFTVWHGLDRQGYAPAYRQVIDLADFDRSTFQLPAGNSGLPGHPHYDDCIEEYLEGRYRQLLYSRAAVERHAEHALRLETE